MGRKMQRYLDAPMGATVPKVKKQSVSAQVHVAVTPTRNTCVVIQLQLVSSIDHLCAPHNIY
jgi:hypothetical protein